MNYFVQIMGNCKVFFMFNFVFFWLFNHKVFEIILVTRKIFAVLFAFSANMPQIFKIETLGLSAITQAEIIIVLGVLGIVATSTIPVMYTDYQRNFTIIRLQRDYAILSSGFNQAINENGTPDTWGSANSGGPTDLAGINNVFSRYFKLAKNCGTGSGCFPTIIYQNLKGVDAQTILDQDPQYTKLLLLDGTSLAISQLDSSCNQNWGNTPELSHVCGLLELDVNGEKAPNTYGIDFFGFAYTKYGIVPLGSPLQSNGYPFSGFCNTNSNANFKYENGLSCTAWVMYNKNMDYLDCKGLNWNNGKTSCKG